METNTMTNYQKQAQDFLTATKTTFKAEFVKYGKHFENDTDSRDIYKITLQRGDRSYSFNFGQSIQASGEYWLYGNAKRGIAKKITHNQKGEKLSIPYLKKISDTEEGNPLFDRHSWDKNKNYAIPTAYDVLAALQKYDVGTFEDFCSDFGYDVDSRKAEKTYKAVVNEWENVQRLWTEDKLNQLREIQ